MAERAPACRPASAPSMWLLSRWRLVLLAGVRVARVVHVLRGGREEVSERAERVEGDKRAREKGPQGLVDRDVVVLEALEHCRWCLVGDGDCDRPARVENVSAGRHVCLCHMVLSRQCE